MNEKCKIGHELNTVASREATMGRQPAPFNPERMNPVKAEKVETVNWTARQSHEAAKTKGGN